MEKKRILLDNNTIDLVCENFEFFKSIKDKYSFFICASTLEEFANMNVPDFKKLKSDIMTTREIAVELCENRHNKFVKNLILLVSLEPTFLLDSVCIPDYSRFDCCRLGDGKVYNIIRKYSGVGIRDAILADTAVASNCTLLLAGDTRLYNAMIDSHLPVMNFNELKKEIERSN